MPALYEMRTLSHDVFINKCNILSPNMLNSGEDAAWRKELG